MATRDSDNRFLFGLVIGAGLGLAAVFLLDPQRGRQNREMLISGARTVAQRVFPERRMPRGQRKLDRAGRKLEKRIERIRSTGF